ncbi:hypothetical protein V8D89_006769 [Ganoderma adspersum]
MNGTASSSTAASMTAEEAAALNGAMDMLLLAAMCTGILVPISIALFFSFSRIWRTPIFILNVFALALGFAYGGMTINYLKGAFAGNIPSSRFTLAFSAMAFCIPVCVQAVLIVRVVAVYPPRTLTWVRNLLIYGFFTAVFIARLVNMSIYLTKVSRRIHQTGADSITISVYEMSLPNGKVEWFLQSVNDLYASTLFLLRLNKARAFRSKESGTAVSVLTNGGAHSSYSERLKALFWIAVFNFVFPVIINVVIVIMSFREPNVLRTSDFIELNNYVEIICVLLATIWCTGTYWDHAPARSMASNRLLEGGETTESLASAKFATRSVADSHRALSNVEMVHIQN